MTTTGFADRLRLSRRETLRALGGAAAGLSFMRMAGATASAADRVAAVDWEQIPSQFLMDPELAYLNTGSLGASPLAALEAARAAAQQIEQNPVAQGFGPVLADAEKTRQVFADLLGCKLEEVCVTGNTSDGMNLVAEGLNLQPGDHVVTTNHEHAGGRRCWEFLAKRRGVILDFADIGSPPASEDEVVDRVASAITPKTRVISVSQVTFSSGVQLPIARLSELAHRSGCLLCVDGAQAAGALPVNVAELGCDTYATSGHKWLLGAKGTGLLYVSERVKDRVAPMRLDDGYGVYTAIGGTNDMVGIIGLAAAVEWAGTLGHAAVFERIMRSREELYAALAVQPGVKINSPPSGSSMASHLVCFTIEDHDKLGKVNEQFAKDKIVVKTVHHGGIDFRVGCHVYNRPEDISRFAASLKAAMT
ncbi:MAG: aminotransferase class V-fold PLP-dependent enzyme [Planctomycetaceae bacterium]|nr:aminotransferase class V-fold PLP-dependent enzyme [Planctomycetaceae bacterium]